MKTCDDNGVKGTTAFNGGKYNFPPAEILTEKQRQTNMVQIIKRILTSKLPNMTEEIACGIVGNMKYVSNCNPTTVGENGTSYGLCKWSGKHLDALMEYCNKNNYSYNTIDGQLKFLINDLLNDEKTTYDIMSDELTRGDIEYTAYFFCFLYGHVRENTDALCKLREETAKEVLKQYTKLKLV